MNRTSTSEVKVYDLIQVHCCVTMMNWQKVLSL